MLIRLQRAIATHPLWCGVIAVVISGAVAVAVVLAVRDYIETTQRVRLDYDLQQYVLDLKGQTLSGSVMGSAVLMGLGDRMIKNSAQNMLPLDSPLVMDPLRVVLEYFKASAVYVVDQEGTIAAWQSWGRSIAGKNIGFRPYFIQAMAGLENVYAAVGTNTGQRGLYFAAPVYASNGTDSAVVGAVVIKMPPRGIEDVLGRIPDIAVLLSPQGVVYGTNHEGWRYRMTPPVTPERVAAVRASRQFGNVWGEGLPEALPVSLARGGVSLDGRRYAEATLPLQWNDPAGNWSLLILRDTSNWFPAFSRFGIGVGAFLIALLLFGSAFLLNRNAYLQRVSGERFRKLSRALEASPVSVLITDFRGVIEYVNPKFSSISGYGANEAVGKTPSLLKSGKTPPEVYRDLWHTITQGQEWHGELINRKKAGQLYWDSAYISPIRDRRGNITHYVSVQEDITERKRLAEQVEHAKRRLQEIADSIPGAVYQFRTEPGGRYHFTFMGDGVEDLLGVSRQSTLEDFEHAFEGLPRRDRANLMGGLRTAESRREPWEQNFRVVHAEQQTRWIHGVAVPRAEGDGLLWNGYWVDVSERKRSEERFKSLLNSTPDPMLIVDDKARITYVNAHAVCAFGYQREELLGQPVEVLVPERLRGGHPALRNAYLERPEPRGISGGRGLLARRRDGTEFPVDLSLNPIRIAGEGLQVVASVRDISDHLKMQDDLAEAKEVAEAATRAKGEFLANMSHEIRTPMNAIMGLSHLALGTELDRRQRDYLTKIDASARSLLGIINDILDFSKIEAGRLDIESIDFDLDEVLDNVAGMIAIKAGEKGIEFLIDLPPDLPTRLRGDPLRLGQVLINLCNNAVKFTDDGQITVTLTLSGETEDGLLLRFEVRDTGIGMNAEQRGRLFKSFSQADTSTSRKYGGTGLGLTISKRLVEMMGGEIGVESVPGEGSIFHFTARFLGASGSGRDRPGADVAALMGIRALVVDDNPTSRQIICRYLQTFGMEPEQAASGEEALKDLERGGEPPCRLVFMDWKMPGMSGLEASRRIRESAEITPKPAIIMISAYGREEFMQQARDLQLEGYLVKPVNASVLLDATLQALGHRVESTGEDDRSRDPDVASRLRGASLLLVEDNLINQQVAREILEKAGFRVTLAGDGRQALDRLNEQQFDGVLMDMHMPDMDGLEATRRLRADPRFADLPVLAMTAAALPEEKERCLAAGMNDHIAKPIDIKALFDTLDRYIRVGTDQSPPAGGATSDHAPGLSGDTGGEPTDPQPAEGDRPDAPTSGGRPRESKLPDSDTVGLAVEGIDIGLGLGHVAGNAGLYRRLLVQFRDGQKDFRQRFEEALEDAGDPQAATRLVHTLKGVAATLGAERIHAVAAELESACRADADAAARDNLLEQLIEALAPTLRSLDALEETSHPEPTSQSVDIAIVKQRMERLSPLLEDYDAAALELTEALEGDTRGTPWNDDFADLNARVGEFRFDAARELLARLRAAIDPR